MPYVLTYLSALSHHRPSFRCVKENGRPWSAPRVAPLSQGKRLTEQTNPSVKDLYKTAYLLTPEKKLHEILPVGSELAISERLRDIIEAIDPGVHQYLPVTLMKTRTEPFEGHYWLLNICRLLDSVVMGLGGQASNRETSTPFRTNRKAVFEGCHLWREEKYLLDVYFSDALYAACRKKKIAGVQEPIFVKSVDV